MIQQLLISKEDGQWSCGGEAASKLVQEGSKVHQHRTDHYGSGLRIYEHIRLNGRLQNVCCIFDDAILEIEFLSQQGWSVACDKVFLVMAGKVLQCTYRMSRQLANKVQVA